METREFKYDFKNKYPSRGCALIIGNEFKGQDLLERKGCARDMKMMEELFTRLDFKVKIRKNLKAADMKKELQKAAIAPKNEDSDCFVFVLSTHGEEVRVEKVPGYPSEADVWKHVVLGNDGKDEKFGRMFVEDIVDMFTDEKAPGLAGKPKLFFLQACRSRGSSNRLIRISNPRYDQGFSISFGTARPSLLQSVMGAILKLRRKKKTEIREKHWLYTDSVDYKNKDDETDDENRGTDDDDDDLTDEYSEEEGDNLDDSEEETEEEYEDATRGSLEEDALRENPQDSTIPMPATPFNIVPISCPNDFLIMYPVMPGKSAFRTPSGSYLLQCLYKGENLSKLLKGNSILQYLTSVSQDVAKYDFLPDLIMKGVSGEEKDRLLRRWIEGNIETLSKNKTLLTEVLGKKHKKLTEMQSEILVKDFLKENFVTFTRKEMRKILRRILPFKMTACLVHRLRADVCLYPKSPNTRMAKAKKRLEETGRLSN